MGAGILMLVLVNAYACRLKHKVLIDDGIYYICRRSFGNHCHCDIKLR